MSIIYFIIIIFYIYFLAQLNENLDANLYICLIKEDKELAKTGKLILLQTNQNKIHQVEFLALSN